MRRFISDFFEVVVVVVVVVFKLRVFIFTRAIMRGSSSAAASGRRRSGAAGLLCPLLGACLWAAVVAHRPVIIVHGLFDSSGDFKNLLRFINQVSGDPQKKKAQKAEFWYNVYFTCCRPDRYTLPAPCKIPNTALYITTLCCTYTIKSGVFYTTVQALTLLQ